jgi:hypothetical protein
MKHLRLALLVFVSICGLVRAQDDEDRRQMPQTEIPDFSDLGDYIYEPKSTVTFGFRHLSGAKTKFAGTGFVAAPEDPGKTITDANIARSYHDGVVRPDARTTPRLDSSGNAVVDPESGVALSDPIAPDGKTNSWSYRDARQLLEEPGYVAFHSFSADVSSGTLSNAAASTNGLELVVMHDMGKIGKTKMSWNLTAGMSVNDISSKLNGKVNATVHTLSDFYSLFGQTPPDGPYSAPSSATQTVVDANGNTVLNADGSGQSVAVDTTVLLGNKPVDRRETTTTDSNVVSNLWKLKGSYFTFRAGPTVWVPITSRFRFSLSLGAAIAYAGTTYTVTESFQPVVGDEISETNSSYTSKLLPGYYADATLQFDLTERAGFYAGAVFQSTGNYDQKLEATNAHYTTNVDLKNQNGLRAGMTIRF